jgi:general secretion pathway protein M
VAAWVCAAGLLWWLALAPALATLRQAPAQHAQLDAQLSHMRQLSALATHLQAQPVRSSEERLAALQADTRRLLGDTARVRVSGEQVTVSVGATHPDTLAQWLADVRANARLTPAEARLSRTTGPASTQAANRSAPTVASAPATGGGPTAPPAPEAQTQAKPLWQGELVFALGNHSGR